MKSNLIPLTHERQDRATPPEPPTDEELMIACGKGSEDAFRQLVDRYSSKILNLLTRWVGQRDWAEDLTQEVFLRVYRNREKYQKVGRFSSWLYTIAINLARNEIRNAKRRGTSIAIDTVSGTDEAGTLHIADERPRPDEWARRKDIVRVVREAIMRLPDHYREVVILRDLQGLTYEEIADILDIPGGTVRSRINRARVELQTRLRPLLSSRQLSGLLA